jgi:hypothetical protein
MLYKRWQFKEMFIIVVKRTMTRKVGFIIAAKGKENVK